MSTIKSSDEHLTLNADGASKDIKLQSNASEKVIVKSTGNVGIGTSSPDSNSKLHVYNGASGQSSATNNTEVVIENNSTTGISFLTPNNASSGLWFADPESNASGRFYYTHSDNSLNVFTGGTQRLKIDGDGLKFNSDTAAANALDDYEEGTHQITPSMSSSGSITLSTSYDRFSYTKIGRLVTIIGNPRINSVSSPVGAIRLTLPFNVKNGQIDESRAGFVVSYFDYSAGAGNYYKQVNAYTQENTNLLTLENTNSNGNTFTPAGTDEFYFSFSYITD